MPLVQTIFTCPKGHRFWSEKGVPANCTTKNCKTVAYPNQAKADRPVQFTDKERAALSVPLGKKAAEGFKNYKAVDRELKSIQAKYPHFPGLA